MKTVSVVRPCNCQGEVAGDCPICGNCGVMKVELPITFINLTPHAIHEVISGQTFPPSGKVARVSSTSVEIGTLLGCPIFNTEYGEVEGLPNSVDGTVLLVSGLVLEATRQVGRCDCAAPGELVRDSDGNPVGCKGFRR